MVNELNKKIEEKLKDIEKQVQAADIFHKLLVKLDGKTISEQLCDVFSEAYGENAEYMREARNKTAPARIKVGSVMIYLAGNTGDIIDADLLREKNRHMYECYTKKRFLEDALKCGIADHLVSMAKLVCDIQKKAADLVFKHYLHEIDGFKLSNIIAHLKNK